MRTATIDNHLPSRSVSPLSHSASTFGAALLKRLLVSAAIVGTALTVPVAAALPASASTQAHTSTAASCYRQVGSHWVCITPGAFCPKGAHQRYGYAKVTKRKYECLYKNSDPYWRWRRA